MDFGDKLRDIRMKRKLSQEELAAEIGVSRQAVTKWENNRGMPDIENIKIISEIFKMTLDELINGETLILENSEHPEHLYTSEVIYDVDLQKNFELTMIEANQLILKGGDKGKLKVVLSSNVIENIEFFYKIKIEESKNKIELVCISKNNEIDFNEIEDLTITVVLPQSFENSFEIKGNVNELMLENLVNERLEYDGKANKVSIIDFNGRFELTSKDDLELTVDKWKGLIDVYQLHARANIYVHAEQIFNLIDKKRKGKIFWKAQNEQIEPIIYEESDSKVMIRSYHSDTTINLYE